MSTRTDRPAPMDSLAVGQWIIALEPRTVLTQSNVDGDGDTITAHAVQDRSFTDHPYEVVGVDLPFVMLELDGTNEYGKHRRVAINVREWKLKVCTQEFLDAWRASLP